MTFSHVALVLFCSFLVSSSKGETTPTPSLAAVCIFDMDGAGDTNIAGMIRMQMMPGDKKLSIWSEGELFGLSPGLHGFHIHENGDLSDHCKAAGGHYNPMGKNHGAPDVEERHVGDLGNILADEDGLAWVDMEDTVATLEGEFSVMGRAIVIHEGTDDLGLGGEDDSLTTGHAGARAGCCKIIKDF